MSCDPSIPMVPFPIPTLVVVVSQGRSTPCIRDGRPPTFSRNPYFMGPYKPLRNWVDEFNYPLLYGNFMGVDRPDRTFGDLR